MHTILTINDRHEVHNIYKSKCTHCRHFDSSKYVCPAFPDEIPDKYLTGEAMHFEVDPAQVGTIVFEREKQDEFTLEMHAEMLEGEISLFDLKVMGISAMLEKGATMDEALKRYPMTEQEYKDNVKRVFES